MRSYLRILHHTQLRGVFRSRSPESILKEVEMLAAQGVKEFVLISQDTTTYGSDLSLKEWSRQIGGFNSLRVRSRMGAFSILLSNRNHGRAARGDGWSSERL
jgi:hypothetical protein